MTGAGLLSAAFLAVKSANAIDGASWERLLHPKSFRAAFAILLTSTALTLAALGAIGWGLERRRRVAIAAGALMLVVLAAYWISRPMMLGAL